MKGINKMLNEFLNFFKTSGGVQKAVEIIEYTLKYGYSHLMCPGLNLSIIESENIDIYGFLFIVIFVIFYLIRTIPCCVCKNTLRYKQKNN